MVALILSGVFLSAAAAKLLDPWSIRLTVRDLLPSVSRLAASVIASSVVALELATAVALIVLPRRLSLYGAIGTVLLACSFAGAFFLARRRPYRVTCHCFGRLGGGSLSGGTLAVAAALFVGALALTRSGSLGEIAILNSYQPRLIAIAPVMVVVALDLRSRVSASFAPHTRDS